MNENILLALSLVLLVGFLTTAALLADMHFRYKGLLAEQYQLLKDLHDVNREFRRGERK